MDRLKHLWQFCWLVVSMIQATAAPPQDFEKTDIRTIPVAEGLYLLVAVGITTGNVAVSAGEDGVLMVDDQFAPLRQKILEAIGKVSRGPIRLVLNTHWHHDHTGGNELMAKDGVIIVAHENVRKRLSSTQFNEYYWSKTYPPSPPAALPTVTFNDAVTFHLNGEEIYAFHVAPAHTDGDTVVYFRKANVVHMGDLYRAGGYPFIDLSSGGSVDGMIAAADRVLQLIHPGAKIIPGHGPLSSPVSSPKDLKAYRDMLATVRDRILRQIKEGKTVEQVLASKPAAEFGEGNEVRSAEDFVRILYQDLSHPR